MSHEKIICEGPAELRSKNACINGRTAGRNVHDPKDRAHFEEVFQTSRETKDFFFFFGQRLDTF